jgi:SAM-dependent methyltransferase
LLDIGANSGEYSILAAELGYKVVAADFDLGALEILHDRQKSSAYPISPIVFNLARPTPAIGWRNREIESFLQRAEQSFDVCMLLGIIHHLIVSERIPLNELIELLFELKFRHLVVEWINTWDARFREISVTHGEIYAELTESNFESDVSKMFSIERKLNIHGGSRTLYLLQRHLL